MQHFEKKLGIPLSVLDLIMVNVDGSPSRSMQNSLDLARHAERWGYKRYWLAEHHNIKGIASTCYCGIDRLYRRRYFKTVTRKGPCVSKSGIKVN